MVNLSWILRMLFELHGAIPRLLPGNGRAFLPVHMLIEVTYRCNLRCSFCQYLDIIEGRAKPFGPLRGDLSLADLKRCVDQLPRGRLISFAGGETLLRKDFPDLLAHAARRHRVHIITNGSLIDEPVARSYISLAPRRVWRNGLVFVEVSLQGNEDLHDRIVRRKGSWRRATEAVRHRVRIRAAEGKRFPKFGLKLVITGNTVSAMVEFMHLAHGLGVEVVNFLAEHDLVGNANGGDLNALQRSQRTPAGVDPEYLRQQLIRCYELERELGLQIRLTPYVPIDEFVRHYSPDRSLDRAEYVCDGPWSRLAVAADGRYAPMCHYAAGGDVRRQTVREVWNGERFREFRKAVRAARVYPGCSGCCNLRYVGSKAYGLEGVSKEPVALEPIRTTEASAV